MDKAEEKVLDELTVLVHGVKSQSYASYLGAAVLNILDTFTWLPKDWIVMHYG